MRVEIITSEKYPLETGLKKSQKVCAIGDVHGQKDLMQAMLQHMQQDNEAFKNTNLVLLGDLNDRGPNSLGVFDLAIKAKNDFDACHYIMGNHEIILRSSFTEESDHLRKIWLRNGGQSVLDELNMDASRYKDDVAFMQILKDQLGSDRVAYIENLQSHAILGDLLFVHAGLDPDAKLETQFEAAWNERSKTHWAWIREKFLHYPHPFKPYTIIHGHTPVTKSPYKKGDKINVRHRLFEGKMNLDGGSYASNIVAGAIFTKHDYQIINAVYW